MGLLVFIILQITDALTTLLFLHYGVQEANPLIRAVLAKSSYVAALAAPKLLAVILATIAWYSGRRGLLRKVNMLYMVFAAWNLAAAWAEHAAAAR